MLGVGESPELGPALPSALGAGRRLCSGKSAVGDGEGPGVLGRRETPWPAPPPKARLVPAWLRRGGRARALLLHPNAEGRGGQRASSSPRAARGAPFSGGRSLNQPRASGLKRNQIVRTKPGPAGGEEGNPWGWLRWKQPRRGAGPVAGNPCAGGVSSPTDEPGRALCWAVASAHGLRIPGSVVWG